MGYSFIFIGQVTPGQDTPLSFRTCDCNYLVYFRAILQSGLFYQGYIQFLTKKTAEELQRKYPFFMFNDSKNDPTIYGAYTGYPYAVDNQVYIYGMPRPKATSFSEFNPCSIAKRALKRKAKHLVARIVRDSLTPE